MGRGWVCAVRLLNRFVSPVIRVSRKLQQAVKPFTRIYSSMNVFEFS